MSHTINPFFHTSFLRPVLNPGTLAGDGQGLVQLAALSDSLEYVATAIARSGEERAEAADSHVRMLIPLAPYPV